MADEIMKEVWRIKDEIAREHGYDIDRLVAHLREKEKTEGHRVVDLSARKKTAKKRASADKEKAKR